MVVGFASKDVLANLFNCLTLYFDRPYEVGDHIVCRGQDIEGIVQSLSWRTTHVRTFDKRMLYVPNSMFINSAIENRSRLTHRRLREVIGIRYDDAGQMRTITAQVEEMLHAHPDIDNEAGILVYFNAFNSSSLDFFIYSFTRRVDWKEFHALKHDYPVEYHRYCGILWRGIRFPDSYRTCGFRTGCNRGDRIMKASSSTQSSPKEYFFHKMQSIGNDFILFDRRKKPLTLRTKQLQWLADRHYGIGCDQVIVLTHTDDGEGLFCRFYNADGGEAGMCGNGLRCVGHFLHFLDELAVDTPVQINCVGRKVSLRVEKMVMFVWIWGSRTGRRPIYRHRWSSDGTFSVGLETESVEFTAVSMGNPHAVARVADIREVPLDSWGEDGAWPPLFPEGVNIGIMTVIDRRHICLRVYERGVGETLGCGSGACAAVAVGYRYNWLHSPVKVSMRGGEVEVICPDKGSIWLSGPATYVYSGRIVI